jgi:uncharacterized protein
VIAPVSLTDLRRHVVARQGFAARYRRATDEDVAAVVRRLSCVQLDSIATVERSHLLVLGSRVGAIEPDAVSRLLAAGRLFEYWAHEACLLSVEDWPLLRRRMRERRMHHWWGPVIASNRSLAARVLGEIRDRGPLGSRHFEGQAGTGMWRRKPAKQMLDALWTAGELVVRARQGFQRLYDLPERVLPAAVLAAPVPSEKATLRALIVRAVNARGALTARGIVEHYRLSGGTARIRPHLAALCRAGALRELAVADDGAPVYVSAGCDIAAAEPPDCGVLLSPFENLLWDRDFTLRLFGFNHLIEIYKRAHERSYGYYVLPFLVGDRLVGRADLKVNRRDGSIEVKAFHREPGVKRSAKIDAHFERALKRLARTLGLAPSPPARRAPTSVARKAAPEATENVGELDAGSVASRDIT